MDTLEGQKIIKEETPQYIKENYIQKDKIEEILSETEITDFNSLVEAFLEIKKLLESDILSFKIETIIYKPKEITKKLQKEKIFLLNYL